MTYGSMIFQPTHGHGCMAVTLQISMVSSCVTKKKRESLSFLVVALHVFELTSSFSIFNFFKGIFGTKGTGTTSTIPGGQYAANSWTAADGTFCFFSPIEMESIIRGL
jgi:hypothetical protein